MSQCLPRIHKEVASSGEQQCETDDADSTPDHLITTIADHHVAAKHAPQH
ncbi:Uncharacterised protein [Vibrio cholerae]|uniref:Uncharacterized protein n=1 Tax=Vibrio cholerae TaxID=666 RepID=A0A655ZA07_VIBCL|nr:Uncharacterised protein [Vibrio cholerae]